MTRLIHIGDLHMKPGPRSEDRWAALDQIIVQAITAHHAGETIGAWLIPGDLNDARMSIEDRNAWIVRIERMAAVAPVLVCYGNHDLPGDLDFLEHIRAEYPVRVFATPTTVKIALATTTGPVVAVMFVLPYPTKAGLVSLGVAPANVVDEAAQVLDFIFMAAAADLEAARERGEPTFMIGHVNVGGSMTSVGQPNIGHEIELNPALLDRLGPIYKGLNHIHKSQGIAGAFYAGSICRLSWGEIEDKGYYEVELHRDELGGWRYFPRWKRIDVAPMYHVEGSLSKAGFSWAITKGPGGEPVEPSAYPKVTCAACLGEGDITHEVRGTLPCPTCAGQGKLLSWVGAEVRVRYTFFQHERGQLDEKAVAAMFQGAKRLEIEPIAVRTHDVRAPEVAAAQTTADKLTVWAKLGQIRFSPFAMVKLGRLETLDPEAFLAQVQQELIEATTEKVEVPA